VKRLASWNKDMEMNGEYRRPGWWQNWLATLAGAVVLVGTAAGGENAVADGASETAKPASRVSPHALAAQRRAQQVDASAPRVGLQSQMQKGAARRHLAPARRGT
jgi:hypothetical protein